MSADDQLLSIRSAAHRLRAAERVAVLTGAGVSAESGVPTFRGPDGLWEGQRVEDVATPFAFQRDPVMVWRFYNARRAGLAVIRPNPGHLALADLERRWGSDRFTLITQNVDGLHRAAGSANPLEIHGNLRRVRCTDCGQVTDRGIEALDEVPRCPPCAGLLRPDVVWFHESLPPDVWARAEAAARACTCFLVVGTSAIVYPAAGLIEIARDGGAAVIEFNLTATPASGLADIAVLGPSGETLPALLRELDALQIKTGSMV